MGGGAAASLSASGQGSVAGTRAGTGKKHELGLSRNGKTLLVAAYLASHNSRDTGGLFFFFHLFSGRVGAGCGRDSGCRSVTIIC